MTAALAVLLALQTSEQVLEGYRKATEHLARGAYAEAVRLCEDLARQRPDKEGILRVRVGAGLEDREFEPRRVAGDACLQQARNAADLKARQGLVEAALRWYQASADLGLEKAKGLLAAARAEKEKVEKDLAGAEGAELRRRRVEAVKKEVTGKIVGREFEAAFAVLEKARPDFEGDEAALSGIRADLEAEFRRWHDGLVAELRRDLEAFRPEQALREPAPTAERFARYRVAPAQAAPARLDPVLGWAARLGALVEGKPPDSAAALALAEEGVAFGVPAWRAAAGLALELLASQVRDPGPEAALDRRWEAVERAQAAFAPAADRARKVASGAAEKASGAAREDFKQWLAEDLPAFEGRVSRVAKSLPDRDAPAAVDKCLARLDDPAVVGGARGGGYAAVEAELRGLTERAAVEPAVRGRALAGRAAARACALFLEGLSREEVLEKCRDLLQEAYRADASQVDARAGRISPRVAWVFRQARP